MLSLGVINQNWCKLVPNIWTNLEKLVCTPPEHFAIKRKCQNMILTNFDVDNTLKIDFTNFIFGVQIFRTKSEASNFTHAPAVEFTPLQKKQFKSLSYE